MDERTSSRSTTIVCDEEVGTIATINTTTTSTTTDLEMGLVSSLYYNRNQSESSESSESSPSLSSSSPSSSSSSSSSSSTTTASSSTTADDVAPLLQQEPTAHYVSIYLEHQQQQMEAGRLEMQSLKDEITSLRRDLRWRSSVRHRAPVAVAAPPARPQQQQQNNDNNNNNDDDVGGGGGVPEQQKCIKFCCEGINHEYLVKVFACFCFPFFPFWTVGIFLPNDSGGQYIPSQCHEYIENLVDDDDWNSGDSDGISDTGQKLIWISSVVLSCLCWTCICCERIDRYCGCKEERERNRYQ